MWGQFRRDMKHVVFIAVYLGVLAMVMDFVVGVFCGE
jgi:hypothetical protein